MFPVRERRGAARTAGRRRACLTRSRAALTAAAGLALACATAALAAEGRTVQGSLTVGGLPRTYRLHVPAGLPAGRGAPLVLVFHGGGGDGAKAEALTGFSSLADREGFLVAYPDGLWKNWNDGREPTISRAHREKVDDVGFVAALIDTISAEHPVDPKRVFATGISNGGIFSHYLAANLATRIAAIAPVSGGIAERFATVFAPSSPVSVLIVQGTADPIVPYGGGGVLGGRRGRIIDTDEAVRIWAKADGCAAKPRTGALPDADPTDGCRVTWRRWPAGRGGTEVVLYTVEGGGHTWPGAAQYLPRLVVGRVCRDFDATDAIWSFFKEHPRR